MADAILVGLDVGAGEKALNALANSGVVPAVALWAKTGDYDLPRLFVAGGELESMTSREAHGRIAEAVGPEFTWSPPNFVVLRTKDKFISALRAMFGGAADVNGMRLGNQLFGDTYIEDAYVYQIR